MSVGIIPSKNIFSVSGNIWYLAFSPLFYLPCSFATSKIMALHNLISIGPFSSVCKFYQFFHLLSAFHSHELVSPWPGAFPSSFPSIWPVSFIFLRPNSSLSDQELFDISFMLGERITFSFPFFLSSSLLTRFMQVVLGIFLLNYISAASIFSAHLQGDCPAFVVIRQYWYYITGRKYFHCFW